MDFIQFWYEFVLRIFILDCLTVIQQISDTGAALVSVQKVNFWPLVLEYPCAS